jgi:hypothetical protein
MNGMAFSVAEILAPSPTGGAGVGVRLTMAYPPLPTSPLLGEEKDIQKAAPKSG